MWLFNKYDSFCLYGTNLQKNDVVVITSYDELRPNEQDKHIVDKVYRFTIFHRILEFFGKPFKYHNCVRLKRFVPAGEQKHANIPYDNMQNQ